MTGRGNGNGERDRAVTVQIGAVILFGFLIVALSTYQATVVPDQNREVEFLHNQEVQTDMVELSSSMAATGRTGDGAPATVKLGTRYPSRTFFVNPPPASGRLQTVDPPPGAGNVSLENLTVLSSADRDEAADYWDLAKSRNKSTRFVVYEPRYSNYREAPATRYESGVAFNRFSNGANLTLTDQRVVEGDRVTLIAVSGELSRNGVSTVSVDPEAVSTVSRRERVSGELDVTIPTTLNATRWEELLVDEIDDGWVNGTENAPGGGVTIELNDSRTYSLGIAAVHVGDGDGPNRSPAYLDVEKRPSEMSEGTTREVVLEVRDQFGNPVGGVEVTADATGDGQIADTAVTTDEDGRAVFEYTPTATGSEELRFSYDGFESFDAGTPEDANVSVDVNAGGGGGDAGDINPSDSVTLVDSYRKNQTTAVLELRNRGDAAINSSQARINFFADGGGQTPTYADLISAAESPRLDIGGQLQNASITFPSDETVRVCYVFDENLRSDEFFVTSYTFANGGGDQYFAGLTDQRNVACDGTEGGDGGDGGGDGGGGDSPNIAFRLDDLSHVQEDGVEYVGSYAVSNTNGSFQRVEITYENTDDGSATQTLESTGDRGGLTYTSGYGATDTYSVTVEVIYSGPSGEYVAASRSVTDAADASNPAGNDDISTGTSASLSSSTIEDRSSNGQGPQYRFDYAVSTGDYSQTRLAVVSTGTGGKQTETRTTRSATNVDLNEPYGYNEPFKLAILVYGSDGAVVDARIVSDTADGTDP